MWQKQLGIFVIGIVVLVLSPGVQSILGSSNKDVQGEIDRIASRLSSLERPNQMMVDSFIQQIQTHCPNATINETIYQNISDCMEKNFNNTELQEDIREAIPAGKLDEVFHNTCKKWPVARSCMTGLIEVIDTCWSKGDQVNTVLDSMVKFFCGPKNDGEKIALFFADGGMRCLDSHGEEVRDCMMKNEKLKSDYNKASNVNLNELEAQHIPDAQEVCTSLRDIHDCAQKGLRKCDDPTPENLVSSMLKVVAKAVSCPEIHDAPASGYTAGATYMTISAFLLLPSILIAKILM